MRAHERGREGGGEGERERDVGRLRIAEMCAHISLSLSLSRARAPSLSLSLSGCVCVSQRRFFKSKELYELFTLTDDVAQGTETGDIFADVAHEAPHTRRPPTHTRPSPACSPVHPRPCTSVTAVQHPSRGRAEPVHPGSEFKRLHRACTRTP